MVGAVDGGGNEKQQVTSRPPKPTAHSPPSWPHLCDGTLGHEQQWEEKNWRKGGKGRGRCGRGKGIKTSKTKEQELGDSPEQGLRLDQMWRTMGQEAREPEGKGEGGHTVGSERSLYFRSQGHGHFWLLKYVGRD